MWTHGTMILTEANSQRLYQSALAATGTVCRSCHQRHLWQAPVLSGSPAIRDISGESGRVSEGNENLVYLSPWDIKRSFRCRKILRHGTSGFTSHPKKGVLRIFVALKNPSPWSCSNPQPLGPVASTLTTTPPRRLALITVGVKIVSDSDENNSLACVGCCVGCDTVHCNTV
jgi:hypothetical protein